MSRKKKKQIESKVTEEFRLHPETKKSVWAVMFFGAAVILLLARFQSAGPVGGIFYNLFEWLFGIGYYLLPLTLIIMAGVFLASERRRLYKITFLGAVLFVL